MATFVVNTAVDELDGSVFDGDISLRDALAFAVAGDTITFDASVFLPDTNPGSNVNIDLTLGQMTIDKDITINGDVNGDGITDVTLDAEGNSRIFNIDNATVALHALFLAGGSATTGGAIFVDSDSTLTLSNSEFQNNTTSFGGGAIDAQGNLTVVNSAFLANSGGIGAGGAIRNSGDALIVNSTFALNDTGGVGGAFHTSTGNATILNSTFTGNYSGDAGGALSVTSGTLTLGNMISAGNKAASPGNDVSGSITSLGGNVFGSAVTGSGANDTVTGILDLDDIFQRVGSYSVGGTTFDMGVRQSQSGPTNIVPIEIGGIADGFGQVSALPSEADIGFDVDGDGTIEATPLDIDGQLFARITDGVLDSGAVEAKSVLVVDTAADEDDGDFSTGDFSLREAMRLAQDGTQIIFDASVFTADEDELNNATIAFTLGGTSIGNRSFAINGDVNGDGIADVTVDLGGNNNERFTTVGLVGDLAIRSMTFQNAVTDFGGGVIFNSGTLSIADSTFTNNFTGGTGGTGGAIRNNNGSLRIANSTFDRNEADQGGAIFANGSAKTYIANSTFTENFANDGNGGAINMVSAGPGLLDVFNSTLTLNRASGDGGGIYAPIGFTATTTNSIAVGNSSPAGTKDLYGGGIVSGGGNVFGTSSNVVGTDVTLAAPGDVFGETRLIFLDGTFITGGELASNGGATDTVAILAGGLAEGQAVGSAPSEAGLGFDVDGDGTIEATPLEQDQNGAARVIGGSLDAGAVEFNRDLIIVTSLEGATDGDISTDDIGFDEALSLVSDGGTIAFDPGLFSQDDDPTTNIAIQLTGSTVFAKSVTVDGDVDGDGDADVTFDGTNSGGYSIFSLNTGHTVKLNGLTFANGNAVVDGGALNISGDALVTNTNFIGNTSSDPGGAVRVNGTANVVIQSSFFGDNTGEQGGAIRNTGDLTIVSSTFAENAATVLDGGAIQNGSGTLRIVNSTITGNDANANGGAVSNALGSVQIFNSVIGGNNAAGSPEVSGSFTSNGANIFGYGQTGTAAGDLVLTSDAALGDTFDQVGIVNVGGANFLAGLSDLNGGAGPTIGLNLLNPANPAVDAADPAALVEAVLGVDLNFDGDTLDVVAADGRGFGRLVNLPGIGTQSADIGAFEVQTFATPGGDYVTGGLGDDSLSGMAGNDILSGGPGADTLNGGADFDVASYRDSALAVQINLLAGTFLGGDAAFDTLIDIEAIWGSLLADQITGSGANNTLGGLDGNDTIAGGLGDDSLSGDADNDSLIGNNGSDTLLGGAGNDRLIADELGDTGDDSVEGGAGDDLLVGRNGNDTLIGGAENDTAYGGAGDDTLEGNDGADFLSGGTDNDSILGGIGNDTIIGGARNDYIEGGEGADSISGAQQTDTIYGGEGNDTINGVGAFDFLYGEAGDDFITGNRGSDTIEGGADDDRIFGNEENDDISGDGGRDTLFGDEGTDYLKGGDDGDRIFGGIDNDTLEGGASVDRLFGEAGDDILRGDADIDILDGGADNDTLTGGLGSDDYVFTDGFGLDEITDFDALDNNEDIDLRGLTNIVDWADLDANHLFEINPTTVEIRDGPNIITLTGVARADLDAADFLF